MVNTINPKKKIMDRIKKENIEYKETFNKSLVNQYTYTIEIIYKDNEFEEKKYIIAPKFTDYSILEQAYSLAHELGHYNLDKSEHVILKKLTRTSNIIIRNIVERKAWKEAIKICNEEAIPIDKEFYKLKDKCLKTYTNEIKRIINGIISWVFYSIKAYYLILIFLYIAYKCANDNILDLFRIFKYFKGIINAGLVYHTTNCIWGLYIITRVLGSMIKRISNKNEKEYCIYENSK